MRKSMAALLIGLTLAVALSAASCAVTPPTGAVVVGQAPPAPREEVVVEAPSPRHVWVPGYWAWHDGWFWEPGRWVLRPHPAAVWVPGRWDHRGRGWVWSSGHWR
jgi:hypothetical protein